MKRSLVKYYREYGEKYDFYAGYTIGIYIDELGKIIQNTGTQTVLDYGCGRGLQYSVKQWHKQWPPVELALFDPAVPKYAKEPEGKFDGVICCDVLEHIPLFELDAVIDQLVSLTRLWAFIAVCCRKADHKLPDGQNEHVTIYPPDWWEMKLSCAFENKAKVYVRFTP